MKVVSDAGQCYSEYLTRGSDKDLDVTMLGLVRSFKLASAATASVRDGVSHPTELASQTYKYVTKHVS